jgi:hypothetical protein
MSHHYDIQTQVCTMEDHKMCWDLGSSVVHRQQRDKKKKLIFLLNGNEN